MLFRMLLPLVGSLLLLSTAITAQRPEEIMRFNFRFGFFEDEWTPDTDIMKSDVEGVLCQTQYFMSQLLQNATKTKSVHAKATEISWGYYEGQELPAHINFTVEFNDAAIEGDVNWVDDRILVTEMENLGTSGLQRYITDWVWNAEPIDYNYFANANRMAFDGVKMPPVRGQMAAAECPDTEAPTILPTISPAPTLAPTTVAEYEASLLNGNGQGNATRPDGAGDGNGPGGSGPNGQIYQNGAGTAVGPGGELSRDNWPFGPHYNDLEDLDPMADFSLNFAMFEDHENPPSSAEVNALTCQVNEFFTTELRRKLSDGTVHMKAVFVDWFFDEGGAGTSQEDIKVNFTAFAYYGQDEHEQVPLQDVFEAMKLTEAELKDFVENYVWKSEPLQENVFYHTESLSLNAGMGTEPDTQAMLIEADGCVLPLNDDGTPFGGIYGPSGPDGQTFSNGAGTNGSGGGGAVDPTIDPESLGFDGDAKQTRITVNFRVSNLENIKEENAVKASGLDSSFPVFTNELVNELTARDAARRFLVRGRKLRVVVVPESSTVDDVTEYPCPDSALPGLTCHSARAKYDVLMSSDEDPLRVNPDYTSASETAANDGTYNNVLQRVDPDTPLYIGIMTSTDQIPPGSRKRGYDGEGDDDDDSWFKWWYILLLLLILLLCCLCCLFCWMSNQNDQNQQKTTTVQERDVLVEEFEDEDAPNHGAPADGDNEEEFVDDPDGGAGVMVAYDPNAQPPPEAGQMVAYDPDKANRDAAERERILNESSRGEKKKDDDQVWEED